MSVSIWWVKERDKAKNWWVKERNKGENWVGKQTKGIREIMQDPIKAANRITGLPTREELRKRYEEDVESNRGAMEAGVKAGEEQKRYSQEYIQKVSEVNQPWIQTGYAYLQKIMQDPNFDFDKFMGNTPFVFNQDDPSYQFRMQEALKALDRSAAARGRVRSGAQERSVERYASNLASQEYNNAFQRYLLQRQQRLNEYRTNWANALNMARMGFAGTANLQNAYGNWLQGMSNAAANIGNARANYYNQNKLDRQNMYMYGDDMRRWWLNNAMGLGGAALGAGSQMASAGLNTLGSIAALGGGLLAAGAI